MSKVLKSSKVATSKVIEAAERGSNIIFGTSNVSMGFGRLSCQIMPVLHFFQEAVGPTEVVDGPPVSSRTNFHR